MSDPNEELADALESNVREIYEEEAKKLQSYRLLVKLVKDNQAEIELHQSVLDEFKRLLRNAGLELDKPVRPYSPSHVILDLDASESRLRKALGWHAVDRQGYGAGSTPYQTYRLEVKNADNANHEIYVRNSVFDELRKFLSNAQIKNSDPNMPAPLPDSKVLYVEALESDLRRVIGWDGEIRISRKV